MKDFLEGVIHISRDHGGGRREFPNGYANVIFTQQACVNVMTWGGRGGGLKVAKK